MLGIKVLGTGSYAPSNIVTNEDFAKIVETSDEWITTRTGMKQRYMSNGEPTWYMAAEAAKNAIDAAGISPEDIGLIISASVTPDYLFPSSSCLIQREIGSKGAMTFDINAACSGFVYGIDMAAHYLLAGDIKYALVVGAENLTKLVDYSDRSTCVLFGDGAAAVVVEKSENFYTSYLSADGTGAKHMACKLPDPQNAFMTEDKFSFETDIPKTDEFVMYMDGKEVYKFATKALPEAVIKAAEKVSYDIHDIDLIIPHQANIRIIETAAKNLGVSMDKIFVNIQNYGNTSSASIGLGLDEAIKSGRLKRGEKVCLVGFGAGLTYASIIMEY